MRRTRTIIIAVAATLVAGSFYPMPYLAAPDWEVLVVDEQGKGIEGLTVSLGYKNYSTESDSHEMNMTSDSQGHAQFPAQTSSASLVSYLAYSTLSATAGVHASFGRHAHVFVFGAEYLASATTGDFVTDWTGAPDRMQSRIVLAAR